MKLYVYELTVLGQVAYICSPSFSRDSLGWFTGVAGPMHPRLPEKVDALIGDVLVHMNLDDVVAMGFLNPP